MRGYVDVRLTLRCKQSIIKLGNTREKGTGNESETFFSFLKIFGRSGDETFYGMALQELLLKKAKWLHACT